MSRPVSGEASPTAPPSYAAVLGYRRSRHNFIGMQARVVTIRDGVLQVVDRRGEVSERVGLAGARVGLKRGVVEVVAGERRFFLFGWSSANKMPDELALRLAAESAELVLDPTARRSAFDAFAVSRQLRDVLVAAGASEFSKR